MRALVTGGAGFIGSHLCAALAARGHSVRVLDDFSTGSRANLAGLNVQVEEGNAAVPVTAGKAVQGCDTVFHLAAIASVPRGQAAPLESVRSNLMTTAVMLDAARIAGVKSFVLASSCAVYGAAEPPCSEDTLPQPLSLYAATKISSEALVSAAAHAGGLHAVSLRFFNVYGPRQNPKGEYAAVVPKFIEAALAGRSATVFGDGKQTRDFVYVDDVVEALLLAADSKLAASATGRAINIGSGESIDLLQLLAAVKSAMPGAKPPVFQPERRGEVRHSRADISLAPKLLGWRPSVSLADGISRVVKAMGRS